MIILSRTRSLAALLILWMCSAPPVALAASGSDAQPVLPEGEAAADSAAAAAPEPLPEPLTLEAALALADAPHPTLARAAAGVEEAQALQGQAAAGDDLTVRLNGELFWTQPNEVSPYDHDDNRLSLLASKTLYDSGRSGALAAAAEHGVRGEELRYLGSREQRRLEILRRYFDVLLADTAFARDDEALAVAFVAYDKARERNELGQLSDIELLRLESEFRAARSTRVASDADRRAARSRLAMALNRPDDLPGTLLEPDLSGNDRELPVLEEVLARTLAGNSTMLALRESVQSAQREIEAARALRGPTLSGQLELNEYSRDTSTRDDARVGLVLSVPLWQGGRVDAALAKAQARLHRAQAELEARRLELRQAVLEAWQEIANLRERRESMVALNDYRELYLDRSRALYELDVKTDLGDAMVQMTDARFKTVETDYRLALAWARLDALQGALIERSED